MQPESRNLYIGANFRNSQSEPWVELVIGWECFDEKEYWYPVTVSIDNPDADFSTSCATCYWESETQSQIEWTSIFTDYNAAYAAAKKLTS